MLTQQQQSDIRKLVDSEGWQAVHKHPTLGPIWRKAVADAKKYTDATIDR